MPPVTTIALDLEHTLISNVASVFVRPGLHAFLERVRALGPRVVLYTGASRDRARAVLELLAAEGSAPAWFATIPIVEWTPSAACYGKDLAKIPGADVLGTLLVDDTAALILPDQMDQWVPIACWESPYAPDDELARVADVLEVLVAGRTGQEPPAAPASPTR